MNHAACTVMKGLVQDRADDLMEFILSAEVFIHPDSTDFDDLKWKTRVFSALPGRALIPFKVKDNIVHRKTPWSSLFYMPAIPQKPSDRKPGLLQYTVLWS